MASSKNGIAVAARQARDTGIGASGYHIGVDSRLIDSWHSPMSICMILGRWKAQAFGRRSRVPKQDSEHLTMQACSAAVVTSRLSCVIGLNIKLTIKFVSENAV